MTIRVIVNGANGKMGHQSCITFEAHSDFNLVARADQSHSLHELIAQHQPDIVVDFTTPHVVFKNTQLIIEANVRPVIGTTGLNLEQIQQLKSQAAQKKLGGIIAPNFSIGAVLLTRLARETARYFSYAEIIELHHEKKIDAPSGTALKTAQLIRETLQSPPQSTDISSAARGLNVEGIPIHAVRMPGLLAHEEVIFGSHGETLTLRHDTINRECFMPGLMLACKKVMELNELIYGLEHIL